MSSDTNEPRTPSSTTGQSSADGKSQSRGAGPSDALPEAITKRGASKNGQGLVKLDAVYESLRYGEYDIKYGIAEFADNSLDAGANNIWTFIEETEKSFDGRDIEVVGQVAVVDDGEGMGKEELESCLILGASFSPGRGGKRQIGRFGVGMTMAAISLARRVEVYSRTDASDSFKYVYLDLDKVEEGTMEEVPNAVEKSPPEKYANLLKGTSGTIVVLRKPDRLQSDPGAQKKGIRASKQVEGMSYFLGRTYRKFIKAGRKFWYNGNKVYLHDPLYVDGPTYTDENKPDGPDEKANIRGNVIRIPLEVPGSDGEQKNVTVKISVLPEEWRESPGDGGSGFARDRKIHKNEGISVLRANREVLYGKVPYLIGQRGQSKYDQIDRWWGMEISFPPELDDYFEVRYIKRGAQPVASVRDQIRDEITNAIETIRDEIRDHWSVEKRNKSAEEGAFADAEEEMADAEPMLPSSRRGSDQSEDDEDKVIDDLLDDGTTSSDGEGSASDEDAETGERADGEDADRDAEREARKKELKDKPYSIVPTAMSQSVFFEPVFLPGKIIIKLNTQHPFYKNVFAPLCGNLAQVEDGEEFRNFVENGDTEEQRLARKALLLMIFSYAKGESMFADKSLESLFSNLRVQWGTVLGTALSD